MAQAFAAKMGLLAVSAGTQPAQELQPNVVEVMKEKGIDLSRCRPQQVTADMVQRASLIVCMGCSIENFSPITMHNEIQRKLVDWEVKELKRKRIAEIRLTRDEIEAKVMELSQMGSCKS